MVSRSLDLGLVGTAAMVAMVVVLAGVDVPLIRVICGLALVFVLPGYAVTSAAFPRNTLTTSERLLFTGGLSLMSSVLGAFALHTMPQGLQPQTWAVLLVCTSIAASVIALMRRRAQGEVGIAYFSVGLDFRQLVLMSLALLVVGGALAVARDGARKQNTSDFTQLWMLPETHTDQCALRLGVRNMQSSTPLITYRLQIEAEGTIIHEWSPINLESGETWQGTVVLPTEPNSGAVEAMLYRLDEPGPVVYRHVRVWCTSADMTR